MECRSDEENNRIERGREYGYGIEQVCTKLTSQANILHCILQTELNSVCRMYAIALGWDGLHFCLCRRLSVDLFISKVSQCRLKQTNNDSIHGDNMYRVYAPPWYGVRCRQVLCRLL
jgi:hypothetical protein